MLLGLTLAILASLGSGFGSAVEAFGVRKAAAKGEPAGDLGPLLKDHHSGARDLGDRGQRPAGHRAVCPRLATRPGHGGGRGDVYH